MKEKKKVIIESGKKLFSEKGFASTSVREIVEESGISKGAFYIYFTSKDELLIEILRNSFEEIQEDVFRYKNNQLSPYETFVKQLTMFLHTIIEHKQIIIMLSHEQTLPLKDEIKQMIYKQQVETTNFYKDGIAAIYGQKTDSHLWDLAFILEGMFQSFIRLLVFDKELFQIDTLVGYILRRLDNMVDSLASEQPIVTDEKITAIKEAFTTGNNIEMIINKMKKEIKFTRDNDDLRVSLEVLEDEVKKDNPRIPVISGMLFNLGQEPALDELRKSIADHYGIKLT